jgi:UDP-N-acetylmuramoyl-L-alanyl-D-glutamate--2,6-diaminopimelate ligase
MTYSMKATDLLAGIDTVEIEGPRDILVSGIEYDSRSVTDGCLFAALPGLHTDGTSFVEQAIRQGAKTILSETRISYTESGVLYVQVKDIRKELSKISSAFYGNPSGKLVVIGVTGTDGKSTTVWLLHQLLEAMGIKSGFLSTVELKDGDEVTKNPYRQSTPEAPHMHRILAGMVASGKEVAVIEATSHGLSKRTSRLTDVGFDVGIVTNITHEHLEFHGSYDQYRSDKTELFRSLGPQNDKTLSSRVANCKRPFGVVNLGDKSAHYIVSESTAPALTYGIENPKADMNATDIEAFESGSIFSISRGSEKIRVSFPLPGAYNIENLLASCLTVSELLGMPLSAIAEHIPGLTPVHGRMKEIKNGQPFRVLVDYAHTPGAYERVFSMLRPLAKGRIIAVFGSAGERDVAKRPMQGKVASRFCDILVLTDEDPRLEDRQSILEGIWSGCENHTLGENAFMEPDRRKAIRKAFELAKAGDTVILLGKGHEASIIYPQGPMKWNEVAVAQTILSEMEYSEMASINPSGS